MSIRIFSDLHIEFDNRIIAKCVNICKQNPTKYVILAGDITNYKKRNVILPQLFKSLKQYTHHIIYILGNHEYYEGTGTPVQMINDYRKICGDHEVSFLENETLETDDYIFKGTTLWSEINLHAYANVNDNLALTFSQIRTLNAEATLFLTDSINNHTVVKPLIIITHHLPSFTLIHKEYDKYADINTAFANKLDHLIKKPIVYWIYGHTHKPSDLIINDVRMICNPMGYPGERDNYSDCVL